MHGYPRLSLAAYQIIGYAGLERRAMHQRTEEAISMKGDRELPTDRQRTSLVIVMRSLFARLKIETADDQRTYVPQPA